MQEKRGEGGCGGGVTLFESMMLAADGDRHDHLAQTLFWPGLIWTGSSLCAPLPSVAANTRDTSPSIIYDTYDAKGFPRSSSRHYYKLFKV